MNLLFKLSEKEENLSKKLTGKICRIIIPNGHYKQGDVFPENTIVFPENYLPMKKVFSFINDVDGDCVIITNAMGIITAVPDCCVRIIKNGELEKINATTFAGNIGELYIDVFGLGGMLIPKNAEKFIKGLIDNIASCNIEDINLIGELIIRTQLTHIKEIR
jgi:hypothetical protein